MSKKIKKICPTCKKQFTSYLSQYQIYCSKECQYKSMIGKRGRIVPLLKKICPQCNKEFETEKWKDQKFCSVQCGVNFHKGKTYEKRKCLYCKKIFTVEAWKKKKFCSQECATEYYRGKRRWQPLRSNNKRKRRSYPERKLKDGRRITLHRYLMEEKLRRELKSSEQVHHIDMNRHNNIIENFYLYKNSSEHTKGHFSLYKLVASLMENGIIGFKDGEYFIRGSGTNRKSK